VERLPMGMMLMYGAGLISALLGIGSGVLKVPAMDTALRLPIKVSYRLLVHKVFFYYALWVAAKNRDRSIRAVAASSIRSRLCTQ
jgi:uncharacterized membrane protein YfcA